MFIFGKKKRYTIGEKIRYFDGIISDKKSSNKKKNWALLRKNNLERQKQSIRLGDVYVVEDNRMGNTKKKPRLVVVAESKKHKVTVLPVYKDNKIMSLSNFDEQRAISMNSAKEISKNTLYEKRGFRIVKNASLTLKEKTRLQKKVEKYL